MTVDASGKDAAKPETKVLTVAAALQHCSEPHCFEARGVGYTSMEDLSGALGCVTYFDAGGNALTNVDGLVGLGRLKTLLLQGNALRSVRGLGALANIRTLDVSGTGLRSLAVLAEAAFAPKLTTLIASRNKLRAIAEAGAFAKLTTMVVSQNAIADLVLTAPAALQQHPSKPHRLVAQRAGCSSMQDLWGTLDGADYFDGRRNALTNVDELAGLGRLKILLLQGNALRSVRGLGALANIRTLDVSGTGLRSLDDLAEAAFAPKLVTLLASRNKLCGIAAIGAFAKLTTLLVSRNAIADIAPAAALPALARLFASRNRVTEVPPAFAHLDALEELQLPHNALTALPDADVMEQWTRLRVLDVGHNGIDDITPLAALAPSLVTANFRGNPVAQDPEAYKAGIVALCPKIEMIDGVPIQDGPKNVLETGKMRPQGGAAGEKKGKGKQGENKAKAKMKSKSTGESEGRSCVPILVEIEKVLSEQSDARESSTKKKEKREKGKEIDAGVIPVSYWLGLFMICILLWQFGLKLP